MDQTLGKSARSNGDESSSGGAGSGDSQGGKKSDDDEDLVAAIMGGKNARRRRSRSPGLSDKPLRAQFAEARGNAIGLLQRHLRRRQDIPVDVRLPTLPVVPPAEQPLTTSGTVGDVSPAVIPTTPAPPDVTTAGLPTPSIITSINTNTQLEGSSNQVVLSSTPPPSPAGFGPSFSAPLPTASIIFSSANDEGSTTSSAVARTTVTSFVSTSMFPLRNETSASTSWRYSSTTIDETVWVYAFPTVRPATARRTSEHSTTTHHTSEHSTTTHRTNEHSTSTHHSSGHPTTHLTSERHRNSTTSSTRSKTTKTSSRPSASSVILSTSTTGGVGGTAQPSSTSLPPNSQTPNSGGGSSSLTPKLVGGILGALACLALLLGLILMWVRHRKKNRAIQARVEAGYGGPLEGSRGGGDGGIGEKPSITPLAAAAGFFRPAKQSRPSESIASDVGEERGFYKVSGRKLPPAIGGPRPDFRSSRSIAGSSVYPEDDIGGMPTTPVSSVGTGPTRYSAYSSMSAAGSSPISIGAPPGGPSVPVGGVAAPPAESRIQEEPSEGDPPMGTPSFIPRATASPISDVIPRHQLGGTAGRDGLGRSLPSRDGSRASRFTEDIV